MEEKEIREQAKEDAENLWKNELESSFLEKINVSLLEIMRNIDSKFSDYEKKVNPYLNNQRVDIRKVKKMYVKLTLLNDANPLINLIIQCLTNIKTFCAYYLNPEKEKKILSKSKKNPCDAYLGPAYLHLLKNIWGDQREEYSPTEIHTKLKELMKNNYNSNNSAFIMKFILNQLYLELNLDNNQPIDLEKVKDNDLDCLPRNKILNASYSFLKAKKMCLSCQKIVDNDYCIVSPVINIYLDANNGKSNKYSLENNLNELLIERNEDYCIQCKRQQDINIYKYIDKSKEIIIFYIDRKNDPNHNISLSYGYSMKVLNEQYKLITVIKDLPSNNVISCSYIAYIRSFSNHNWYSYDNKDIKICNNGNEIIDDKNASLLIFSRSGSN